MENIFILGKIFMFNVVLFEPEIPPNTGNIIRLCANSGASLHLIEPLGFRLDDKQLRRAGLDYHEFANIQIYKNFADFVDKNGNFERCFAMTTKASNSVFDEKFLAGDTFIFGPETRGLPPEVLQKFPMNQRLRLPMKDGQRSLNLSNSVAICVYEAWRQNNFV